MFGALVHIPTDDFVNGINDEADIADMPNTLGRRYSHIHDIDLFLGELDEDGASFIDLVHRCCAALKE